VQHVGRLRVEAPVVAVGGERLPDPIAVDGQVVEELPHLVRVGAAAQRALPVGVDLGAAIAIARERTTATITTSVVHRRRRVGVSGRVARSARFLIASKTAGAASR